MARSRSFFRYRVKDNAAAAELEQRDARRLVAESALESLHEEGTVPDHHYDRVKKRYRDTLQSMLQAERQAALRLRNERRISDEIARALLEELDLAETRMNLERSA